MRAVETEDVSYLEPVSFGRRPTEPGDRLRDILWAVHPSAQFLSFVLMHNSQLVFATVLVCHAFSPCRYVAFERSPTLMHCSQPRNDGSPFLAPPSVAFTASLRRVNVKPVRRFHHPDITAIYGLLGSAYRRVSTGWPPNIPADFSQLVRVPKVHLQCSAMMPECCAVTPTGDWDREWQTPAPPIAV